MDNGGGGGTSTLDGVASVTGGSGLSPRTRDTNNAGDAGRSELGGLSPRNLPARSQGLPSGSGGGGGVGGMGGQPGVRPRGVQLTAVTFAANDPVMAVGKRPISNFSPPVTWAPVPVKREDVSSGLAKGERAPSTSYHTL